MTVNENVKNVHVVILRNRQIYDIVVKMTKLVDNSSWFVAVIFEPLYEHVYSPEGR